MLTIQKLKFALACLVPLLAAGAVALGMIKDDPQRFEKGLRGEVVSVATAAGGGTASVTVRLDEFDALLSLDVAADAKVWVAYEPAKVADLRKGQYVSLRLGDDHRTVREVHVRGVQREVVVTAVDASGTITATDAPGDDDDDDAGVPKPAAPAAAKEYRLADGAVLKIGGLPAAAADLKPGMRIPLELGPDGTRVNAVEAEAREGDVIKGEVAVVGPSILSVKVDDEEAGVAGERTITVDADAKVLVDGKPAALAAVRPGSEVSVRLSPDRGTARAVVATSPGADDDDDDEKEKRE